MAWWDLGVARQEGRSYGISLWRFDDIIDAH